MYKKLIGSGLITLAVVAGLVSGTAEAHQDPLTCNASGLQQFPSVSPSTQVYDGSLLTYTVIYSNLDPDGAGAVSPCNLTGLDATIDLPGAAPVINVLTNASLAVGESISCPGGAGCAPGPYTYTVTHSDETAGGVTANFAIDGVLHQSAEENTAADTDNLSSDVIHPNTLLSASVTPTTVTSNGTTTLTITENNAGDVTLTNVFVEVDQGIGILNATSSGFSGDDGDSILEPGETWQWVRNIVVTSSTIWTATGHGTDPLGADITFPTDQDERDTAEVTVVTPSTIVDISSSVATTTAGGTTTLTVTETNDGTVPLSDVHVDVDQGVGTLNSSTSGFSGDDGDSILEPGETWQWIVSGVVVNSTTVFTATGFGTDPSANVITYPGDAEERDSVTVAAFTSSTAVSIESSIATSTGSGTTTLTITETNDGTSDLSNVHVDVDQGVGSFTSASLGFSGDDGDSLLEPGETWTWVTDVFVSTTTTFTATGFGTDPLDNVITYPGDTDERDAVTVTVIQITYDGCTLGYWKNHIGSWEGFTPDQTLESVFDIPDSFNLDDVTLLQALKFGGGSGDLGGAKILLKQAVASLLNSSHSLVDFPLTTAEVISQTNAALIGTRSDMTTLAGTLDSQNQIGCSINAHGEAI